MSVTSSRDIDDITQEVTVPTEVRPLRNKFVLYVLEGPRVGETYILERGYAVVGRGGDADFRIPDPSLSRAHARFDRDGDTLSVTDLDSRNGTAVEGQRVSSRVVLKNGDLITLGQVRLRFSLEDARELEASRELYEAAVRDRLTGLFNRGHFEERLTAEFAFSARHKAPLSVMLLDLDHFKKVNDTYGHPAGDAVLKAVADKVLDTVRKEDIAARYGGEEMAVLVRGDADGAQVLAQRIRTRVSLIEVDTGTAKIRVTTSIGIAVMRKDLPHRSAKDLIAAADEALYNAKKNGRNQVTLNLSVLHATERVDGSYSIKQLAEQPSTRIDQVRIKTPKPP
jgi:diguanylate cyclase (GGDEF)-like protein